VKLGQIHVLQGDVEGAIKYYNQALAANPTCTMAQETLAKIEQDAAGKGDAQI
jgi:TolA-binding protein